MGAVPERSQVLGGMEELREEGTVAVIDPDLDDTDVPSQIVQTPSALGTGVYALMVVITLCKGTVALEIIARPRRVDVVGIGLRLTGFSGRVRANQRAEHQIANRTTLLQSTNVRPTNLS